MRISAPPIRYPCHYGVDMSTKQEMVAHGRTVDEIAEELELRLDRLPLAGGRLRGDPRRARHPLRRLLLGRLPARAHRRRERQVRARGARRRSHVTTLRHGPRTACRDGTPRPAGPAATVAARWTSTPPSQRNFGFTGFRPGQREACEAALADRDVLVVMPTGSGKSLCYQLPALMRDDLTVVVSPLVALMQDQVEALHARGLGDAGRRSSTPSRTTAANAGGHASARPRATLRLLYVAPERFSSPGFLDRHASRLDVGLFVVDEAHCVSQWGHDFRPDYFRLADAARHLGARAIVASTATATPRVAVDIVAPARAARAAEGGHRASTGRTSRSRSPGPAPHEKRPLIAEALRRADDALPAIVYAGTRAGAEEIAEALTRGARRGGRAPTTPVSTREQRAAVQRRLPRRRGARDRGHQRVRHGRRQAQRAHGACTRACRRRSRPTTRRPAAPGATACPHGRCCSPRTATRRCTSTSSSARRSTPSFPAALAERLIARGRRRRALRGRRARAGRRRRRRLRPPAGAARPPRARAA